MKTFFFFVLTSFWIPFAWRIRTPPFDGRRWFLLVAAAASRKTSPRARATFAGSHPPTENDVAAELDYSIFVVSSTEAVEAESEVAAFSAAR